MPTEDQYDPFPTWFDQFIEVLETGDQMRITALAAIQLHKLDPQGDLARYIRKYGLQGADVLFFLPAAVWYMRYITASVLMEYLPWWYLAKPIYKRARNDLTIVIHLSKYASKRGMAAKKRFYTELDKSVRQL